MLAASVRQRCPLCRPGSKRCPRQSAEFDKALAALHEGDTLVITTLDRLGRSTVNILDLSTEFHDQGIDLRVLNLGGDKVDTWAPMGGVVVTVMAALAQMELKIKRERITDSVSNAGWLIEGGEPATPMSPGTWECHALPSTGALRRSMRNSGSGPEASDTSSARLCACQR